MPDAFSSPRPPLPSPATLADIYLYDIASSLRAIAAVMTPVQADPSDAELKEPASPHASGNAKTKGKGSK
jgi:hypothetical protein